MADIEISPLVETWEIANLTIWPLALSDVPGLNANPLPPLDGDGNPVWIDALDFTDADILAASDTFRNALITPPVSAATRGYKHTHQGLYDADANGDPVPDASTWHSHSGMDILTGGVASDADSLHTHGSFITSSEVDTAISTAIGDIDFDVYVIKNGSINQLVDITSDGATIEAAILLAHAQDHTLLEHLDDDPITMANVLKLFDGSNADCCHTHSNLGGGTFDGEHNDLDGLNEGAYWHLTAAEYINFDTNFGTLTDGSNADLLHTHVGGGGSFEGDHNELDGLQGGSFSANPSLLEYYHLNYDEYIALVGGPSNSADDYHTHGWPTTAYELPLGPTCDAGWEGGLFAWTVDTETSCALDDVNEVLGSLAPSPAPDLDDVSVDNASGVSEDLSFGSSQAIAGYTSCTGIGVLSPIDINGTFTNSGKREGIINDGVDISGVLASDIAEGDGSPTVAYPAQSFGDAELGILILELNGVEQTSQNIVLTNSAAQDTTSSGTATGLDVILATSVKFPGGASFDQFKYRTGTYHIESGDMRNGWNYARVIHRIGGSDSNTNYVDWVVDVVNTATSFSLEALDTYNPSASKHLSGVEYDTAATALYDITITNAYLNTYVTSTTAVTFNETALNSVSNENLANVPIGGDKENATHVITDKTVTVDTSNRRLINQSIALSTRLNRTVQTDSNSGGDSITGILFDNYNSSATESGVEDFIAETYRMRSNSDFTNTTFTSNWDETEFIYDAGNTGYLEGLQVVSDILDYPTVDYRNTGDGGSITEGRSGNPDYSGGACTGTRYYYRYFKNTSTSTANFTMNFNGSGTFVAEDEGAFTGNKIKVSIRLPSQTAWMDCYYDFVTNQWNDGDGCRASGGRDFDDWLLTVGTKNTANSGDGIYIRITVPVNWTGNISHLTMAFS